MIADKAKIRKELLRQFGGIAWSELSFTSTWIYCKNGQLFLRFNDGYCHPTRTPITWKDAYKIISEAENVTFVSEAYKKVVRMILDKAPRIVRGMEGRGLYVHENKVLAVSSEFPRDNALAHLIIPFALFDLGYKESDLPRFVDGGQVIKILYRLAGEYAD